MKRFVVGLVAALYIGACFLPSEPSGAERIEFQLDFALPYRVPLAGTVEPNIKVTASGRALSNPHYRLESLDEGVLRVDATGRRLEGVRRGTSSVRVVYQTGTGTPDTTFPVQVVVSRIAVGPSSTSLTRLGATAPLSAVAYDANDATVPSVEFTWSSADAQVATVNDTGLVVAVDEGTVAITAQADSVKALASVTVTQVAAQVRLAPELDTLRTVGRTVQFFALAFDSSGAFLSDAKARWTSSNAAVATVGATGLATAQSAGVAKIIARVGDAADTATLVVKQVLRFLVVAPGLDTLTAIDDTGRVSATGTDSLGSAIPDLLVTWATNNSAIATVDQTGLVRAQANGVALITATSGGQSAFGAIVVRQKVAAARLSQETVTLTGEGDTVRLSATGLDRNGYLVEGAAFVWRSGFGCVATVDAAGVVTARGAGSTEITAAPSDGGQADTAAVTVAGAPPPCAWAAIAFESRQGIEVIRADGSGRTVLIRGTLAEPAWSPDGARLAFSQSSDGWQSCAIHTARADGSEVRQVTTPDVEECDRSPAWSPDGTKIAFGRAFGPRMVSGGSLVVVGADGSGFTELDRDPESSFTSPTWSPDGTKIAFTLGVAFDGFFFGWYIAVVGADGTGGSTVVDSKILTGRGAEDPVWSPDGSELAFQQNGIIWVMKPDGTGAVSLMTPGHHPAWSPDASRIVFSRPGLYVIPRHGSGLQQLTSAAEFDANPAWRRAQAPTAPQQ